MIIAGEQTSTLVWGEGTFDFAGMAGQLEGVNPILTLESHTREDLEKSLKFMESWDV